MKRKFIKTCVMAGCRRSVEVNDRNGFARCDLHQKTYQHYDAKYPLVKKVNTDKPKPKPKVVATRITVKKVMVEGW